MNEPIRIPPHLISEPLHDAIANHNYRVDFTWRHVGSNCKPFKQSPSTVPADMAVPSRVPAVEHSGSIQKAS